MEFPAPRRQFRTLFIRSGINCRLKPTRCDEGPGAALQVRESHAVELGPPLAARDLEHLAASPHRPRYPCQCLPWTEPLRQRVSCRCSTASASARRATTTAAASVGHVAISAMRRARWAWRTSPAGTGRARRPVGDRAGARRTRWYVWVRRVAPTDAAGLVLGRGGREMAASAAMKPRPCALHTTARAVSAGRPRRRPS